MAEHLVVELVAQGSEVGGDGFGVGVFGVEIGGDFGIFLVAKPGVVVDEGDAVEGGFFVVFAGDGGSGERAFGHGSFKCRRVDSGHTNSLESRVWELGLLHASWAHAAELVTCRSV